MLNLKVENLICCNRIFMIIVCFKDVFKEMLYFYFEWIKVNVGEMDEYFVENLCYFLNEC